jgi:hypothetical protein
MITLTEIVQDTDSTGHSPEERQEENAAPHCRCEIWHHLVETRLYSLECHNAIKENVKFIAQHTGVNTRSDCTIDERRLDHCHTRCCTVQLSLDGAGWRQ